MLEICLDRSWRLVGDGMEAAASGAVYRFRGFVLDLARGALLDAKGVEVPLRAKSFELLRLFVTNAGRLLDRDEINKAIWADVIVTDASVTQCVRDIRRALGDEQQRILKTVLRRGYIFTATIASGNDQQPTGVSDEHLPLPGKPSIAVLAFTNMSGDPEQEYLSDRIADDIITELSRSRSLFVIARNSSFTYRGHAVDVRQVARELGVRYVLEGSVRRSDSRVRATAQLIDAETGNHIWAERYDRALEDVFAVQDEITQAVVTAILPAVADAELRRAFRKPPESLGAWEDYQRGLWHIGKASAEDNRRAKQFFERAMTADQAFVPAYTAMGVAWNQEGTVFGTSPFHEGVPNTCSLLDSTPLPWPYKPARKPDRRVQRIALPACCPPHLPFRCARGRVDSLPMRQGSLVAYERRSSYRWQDRGDNSLRDLILHGKHIFKCAVVPVPPDVVSCFRMGANTAVAAAHAALEHIRHTQLTRHLPYIHCMPSVGEARVARDYEQRCRRRSHQRSTVFSGSPLIIGE